jgi:hypothetical protein
MNKLLDAEIGVKTRVFLVCNNQLVLKPDSPKNESRNNILKI